MAVFEGPRTVDPVFLRVLTPEVKVLRFRGLQPPAISNQRAWRRLTGGTEEIESRWLVRDSRGQRTGSRIRHLFRETWPWSRMSIVSQTSPSSWWSLPVAIRRIRPRVSR